MRILKNAWFRRFARDQKVTDHALRDAVRRAESGQIDANLGGGVVKQRVARPGYETFAKRPLSLNLCVAFGF